MVVPCPACGDVRYSIGPAGLPQRGCWACGHVWRPATEPGPAPAARSALEDPAVRAAIDKLDGEVVRVRRGRRPRGSPG